MDERRERTKKERGRRLGRDSYEPDHDGLDPLRILQQEPKAAKLLTNNKAKKETAWRHHRLWMLYGFSDRVAQSSDRLDP